MLYLLGAVQMPRRAWSAGVVGQVCMIATAALPPFGRPAGMGRAMVCPSQLMINPVRARTHAHVSIQGMIP
jgi:hypothetical protein